MMKLNNVNVQESFTDYTCVSDYVEFHKQIIILQNRFSGKPQLITERNHADRQATETRACMYDSIFYISHLVGQLLQRN